MRSKDNSMLDHVWGLGHFGRSHLGQGHYGRSHFGHDHLGWGHFGPLI